MPRLLLALLCVLLTLPAAAQSGGSSPQDPGVRPVTRTYAITNARVVQAPGRVLERATVVVRDGLIEAVGPNVAVPFDARTIEGDSLVVYAGFVDALGHVAVREPTVEQERVANPDNPPRDRSGVLPDRLARTLLNAEDAAIGQMRQAGFTVAHVAPRTGMLSGQSAVVLLAGGTPEALVLVPEAATVVRFAGASGVYPSTPMAVAAALRQHVREARRVAGAEARAAADPAGVRRVAYDPVAAALGPAVRRERPVFFVAESALEGHRALRLGQELELDVVLAGVPEVSPLTDALRQRRRAVLAPLALPKAVPADTAAAALREDPTEAEAAHLAGDFFVSERRTRSYADVAAEADVLRERQRTSVARYERSPRALHEAGVPFAFATLGAAPGDVPGNLRRMVAAGLPADAALAALTTAPAEVLGLARRIGTVEAGKLANLVLTDGDYFAEGTRVRYVFVDGERFEIGEAASGARDDPDAEVTASGTWDVTVTTPEGAISGQLTLSGTADALAGTLSLVPLGSFSVESVTLTGNRLTFAVPGTPIGRAEASVLITGDALEGEIRAPGAPAAPLTGTRRPG